MLTKSISAQIIIYFFIFFCKKNSINWFLMFCIIFLNFGKKLLYVLKTLFSEKKNLLGKKCYNMWLKHFLCVADLVFSTILNKLLLNSKFSISRSDAWMKSWMPWPTTTTTSTWTKPPWSTRSMCTSDCWTRSSTASSSTCRSRWRS